MGTTLSDSPVQAPAGESAIAPVAIDGLPAEIEGLGRRWQRKAEFHMTVVAAAVIEATAGDDPAAWERVAHVVAGRSVGPIRVRRELRRVRHPEKPELETIVAMAVCPALAGIYRELSAELGVELTPPPAHVCIYWKFVL